MSEDDHSYSSRIEIQMLKTVDYQKFSSIRPFKMLADCHLFRPFSSFNPENSSLKTLDKEDNFRVPEFSELERTLQSGGIEDKLWKEKLTSSSLSTSGRREMVNSSDFKSREHHGNWTHDNHEISQTREENAETPMLLISMKSSPNVAAEHLSTTSNSDTRAPMYQDKQMGFEVIQTDNFSNQQRIFAKQVFELHRLIKVQRLVAKSPEILSEQMLHICNHSTKISPEKELRTQNISETTSSLMKPKIDSQRPNSRQETTAQDAHPKLPLLECDTKKKGHTTPRSTPGPCTVGSGYFHPGNQCIIPVRSPSEGHFYKPHAGAGPRRSPVYASCGVPRLCVIDTDFTMPTLTIQPSSQHGARIQPCAMPEVQTSNSSKSMQASKGSDVHESRVGSPPTNRVHGDALSLFPLGLPFQASYKEIPSNNTEMQGIQVIKVIPHNPKLACESAARIFRSLQEEGQKRK